MNKRFTKSCSNTTSNAKKKINLIINALKFKSTIKKKSKSIDCYIFN
jgi:hypothetical protein